MHSSGLSGADGVVNGLIECHFPFWFRVFGLVQGRTKYWPPTHRATSRELGYFSWLWGTLCSNGVAPARDVSGNETNRQ